MTPEQTEALLVIARNALAAGKEVLVRIRGPERRIMITAIEEEGCVMSITSKDGKTYFVKEDILQVEVRDRDGASLERSG